MPGQAYHSKSQMLFHLLCQFPLSLTSCSVDWLFLTSVTGIWDWPFGLCCLVRHDQWMLRRWCKMVGKCGKTWLTNIAFTVRIPIKPNDVLIRFLWNQDFPLCISKLSHLLIIISSALTSSRYFFILPPSTNCVSLSVSWMLYKRHSRKWDSLFLL